MLRITALKFLVKDLIFVGKNSTIDGVGDNVSKVRGTKSKNIIMSDFLIKLKSLVEQSFKLGFLTFKANLLFAKLKQVFIEILILYHFDLECHIYVQINASRYAISRVFSQLVLDNSGQ